MAIIKTHLYNISFDHDDLMKILIKIDQLKDSIYPQDSKKVANNVKGVSVMDNANPYNDALDYIYHTLDRLHIDKTLQAYHYEEIDIDKTMNIMNTVNARIDQIIEVRDSIAKERDENEEAWALLQKLEDKNLDIDQIKECKYISCRFGKIPVHEKEKIKYYSEYPFIFKEISRNEQYIWGLYAGLTKNISEIDNVFHSMSFEEVELPHFVHGTLEAATSEIAEENAAMDKYIRVMEERLAGVSEEYKEQLLNVFTQLYHLKLLYDQCKYVVDFSHKLAVYAFSSFTLEELQAQLSDIDSVRILELPVTIYQNQGIYSPVLVNNNSIVEPFEGLVKPKVGDTIDPTAIVALVIMITSVLIGDIGVGAILILLGILFGLKKTNHFSGMLKRLGVTILAGGLLLGRAFYVMQVYPAIVSVSLGIGISFMIWVGCCVVSIILGTIVKKVTRKTVKI